MSLGISKPVKNARPFRPGCRLPLQVWQPGSQERIAIVQSRAATSGPPRYEDRHHSDKNLGVGWNLSAHP
jgi:hypothetical protein